MSAATVEHVNTHQPVVDGAAVRCADTDCRHVVYGLLSAATTDPAARDRAERMYRRVHTAEYEPGKAPSIEVEYVLRARCSVCPDGGDVDQTDSETLECSQCHTTWDESGRYGERAEAEQ